jgi:hypothetical protein
MMVVDWGSRQGWAYAEAAEPPFQRGQPHAPHLPGLGSPQLPSASRPRAGYALAAMPFEPLGRWRDYRSKGSSPDFCGRVTPLPHPPNVGWPPFLHLWRSMNGSNSGARLFIMAAVAFAMLALLTFLLGHALS